MSDVSTVTKLLARANEGFNSSTSSTVLSGATIVPLTNVVGLADATTFVGIMEPGTNNEQVFTGTVDLTGSRITDVVWTRGTNVDHATGAQVVDWITGTGFNMLSRHASITHEDNGTMKSGVALPAPVITGAVNAELTTPKVTTSINDANGNEVIRTPAQSSAVNDITVRNAVTGNYPAIEASGSDTNIGLNIKVKGSPLSGGLQYNGVTWRTSPHNWVRDLLAPTYSTAPQGTWSLGGGTGWTYPSFASTFVQNTGTVVNDEIRYKIYLDAGTYTFKHWYGAQTGGGQIQFAVVDMGGSVTNIGSAIDTYAGATAAQSQEFSGLNFTSGDYYFFSFKVTGKNASSSTYKLWYFGTQITRTA